MVGKLSKAEKKIAYDAKLCQLLDEYSQVLIVAADNVGSNQLQNIRRGLRGDSIVLMGKNTMMKRSVRIHSENTGNKAFLNLIPLLVVRSLIGLDLLFLFFFYDYYFVFWTFFVSVCSNLIFFGNRETWVWFSPRVIWRKLVKRLPSTRWDALWLFNWYSFFDKLL